MTDQQMHQLQTGDVIMNEGSKRVYIVTANYRDHVTAVQTVDVTNPTEWTVVSKVIVRA